MHKVLAFMFALALFLVIPVFSPAYAEYQFDTKADKVASLPEKVSEKIGLFLKFDKKAKAAYLRKLLDKRLAELVWAADENINMVEETTSRYSTYAGHYVNFINSKDVESEKEMVPAVFDKHKEVLAEKQKKFEYDSAWWLSIQHDINTLDILK